jgi:hypothetical protein
VYFQQKDIHKYRFEGPAIGYRSILNCFLVLDNSLQKANDVRFHCEAHCGTDNYLLIDKITYRLHTQFVGQEVVKEEMTIDLSICKLNLLYEESTNYLY